MSSYGKQIRKMRGDLALRPAARKIGNMDWSRLAAYERGEKIPTHETFNRIAAGLGYRVTITTRKIR